MLVFGLLVVSVKEFLLVATPNRIGLTGGKRGEESLRLRILIHLHFFSLFANDSASCSGDPTSGSRSPNVLALRIDRRKRDRRLANGVSSGGESYGDSASAHSSSTRRKRFLAGDA